MRGGALFAIYKLAIDDVVYRYIPTRIHNSVSGIIYYGVNIAPNCTGFYVYNYAMISLCLTCR